LIRLPELSGNHTESSNSKTEGAGEENNEFCLTEYLFHISKGSLTCRKVSRLWDDSFTSTLKEVVLRGFYLSKVNRRRPGLNLGLNDEHANHWNTVID
jgi:hypothetical protein